MFPTYGLFSSTDRIANITRNRLRRSGAKPQYWRWLRRFYLAFLLFIASIPLFIYVFPQIDVVLILMIIVIGSAQLFAIFRTISLAMEDPVRQRVTGSWDIVVLTGISAKQLVRGRWWALVQTLWPEWIFIAMVRLGLAYALSQYLYTVFYDFCRIQISRSICYETIVLFGLNAGIVHVIAALAIIIVISLFELGFVAAIGCLAALLPFKQRFMLWLAAIAIWLAVISIGFVSTSEQTGLWLIHQVPQLVWNSTYIPEVFKQGPRDLQKEFFYRDNDVARETGHDLRYAQYIAQLSAFSLADGGTVLAADEMRPILSGDETPFRLILRHLASTALTISILKILTWFFLSAAQYFAIRLGALPSVSQAELRQQSR